MKISHYFIPSRKPALGLLRSQDGSISNHNTTSLSVCSNTHPCGKTACCPLCDPFIPRFSVFLFSTLNCTLGLSWRGCQVVDLSPLTQVVLGGPLMGLFYIWHRYSFCVPFVFPQPLHNFQKTYLVLISWIHRFVSVVRVQRSHPYKRLDATSDKYSLVSTGKLMLFFHKGFRHVIADEAIWCLDLISWLELKSKNIMDPR